ncbi:MAG: hypothetical protein IID30_13170 [Planctomycetes bacterium]|nr:hypothetical protein [Planctomycetota bacterium]
MKMITIDASQIPSGNAVTIINGVKFNVAVSPYQFPKAFEVEYNKDEGTVTIHFKYLGKEQIGEIDHVSDQVTISHGRHSGKILAVHFHADECDIKAIRMFATGEMPELIKQIRPEQISTRLNFDVAASALNVYAPQIAEFAVAQM